MSHYKIISPDGEKAGSKDLDNVDALANVSHEIRNPLNAIIGLSRLLKSVDSSELREEYVDGLIQTSENLLEIVNNLMDFSKLGSGKLTLNKKSTDLRQMIHRSLYSHRIMAESKQLDFFIEIDEQLPPKVIVDSVKLSQIILNLVSNAIKFTAKGGVCVIVKVVEIKEEEVDMEFSVKDTGMGISEEYMEKIFKAFNQGNTDVNIHFGGTGLGLTITRMLIDMMGGCLEVDSEPGQGSEFKFRLIRRIAEQEEEPILAEEPKVALEGLRVLVVDDNKLNRLVACKNLEQWKMRCETAEDGLKALQLLQEQPFDLVLMDLKMPRLDGHQTIKRIREMGDEKISSLPVIALTGSLSAKDKQTLTTEGFSDFLIKPFVPEELLKKISFCQCCTTIE